MAAYMSENPAWHSHDKYDDAEQLDLGDVVGYFPDNTEYSVEATGKPDTGVVVGIDDDHGYATIMWDTGPVTEHVPRFTASLRENHSIRVIAFAYEDLTKQDREDRLGEFV